MSAMSIFDSLELLLSVLVIGLNAYVVYFLTMNWSDLRKHAINGSISVLYFLLKRLVQFELNLNFLRLGSRHARQRHDLDSRTPICDTQRCPIAVEHDGDERDDVLCNVDLWVIY